MVLGVMLTDDHTLARRAAGGEALYTPEQLKRARRWRKEVGQRWEHLTGRERDSR
jgi:hypothetical protein